VGPTRLEPGIDAGWLETLAIANPVRHAYALWDRRFAADRVEFLTLWEGGARRAYLLVWRGRPEVPVVHWVGRPEDPRPLAEALPGRPLIAVVPEALGPLVARLRAPASIRPLLLMEHRRPPPMAGGPVGPGRRLGVEDTEPLRTFARDHPDLLTASYATADLRSDEVFAVVEPRGIVAVARAQAVTPGAWIIGGVYTAPAERGRGYGTAVTRAAVAAAVAAGARPGLFVLEENHPARRLYEGLGFTTIERCAWVDAAGSPVEGPPATRQRNDS
jgi:ribosomal protein S18 acetylase RimI-like enzyme